MIKLFTIFFALLLSLGPGLAGATDDEYVTDIFFGLEAAATETANETPNDAPKDAAEDTAMALDFHKLYKTVGLMGKGLLMPVLSAIIPILAVICACIVSVKSNNNATKSAVQIAQESKQALLNQELWKRARYVMDKKLSLASEVMTLCSLDRINFNHSKKADKRKALDAMDKHKNLLYFNNFQLAALGTEKQLAIVSKISSVMNDISLKIYRLYPDLIDANTPEEHTAIWEQFEPVLLEGHKKLADLAFELKGAIREDFTLFQQQTESSLKASL
jgi:hypothetical protein